MSAIRLAWCLSLAAAVPVCAGGNGAAEALAATLVQPAAGASLPERPFILWSKADAARIRSRIASEEWARRVYEERIVKGPGEMAFLRNLFRYLVMGDAEAAEREKKELLGFAGAPVGDKRRSMQWPNVLRYDTLYDLLSPDERKAIEETFRRHVQWQIDEKELSHTHLSFLPNMEYSRPMSHHLMALGLRDEKLIRAVALSNGGFIEYMGRCVRDKGLYQEEFGKYYSMVFELLLWCRGLDRLGMGELGYDFTGPNGATMRNYLLSPFWMGYPILDLDTPRPAYPMVTMGDAKGNAYGSGQHMIVSGSAANADPNRRSNREFSAAHMNGGLKLDSVYWWELAREKWPDDPHFGYFLAQMRAVNEERYLPTLLFDIAPIAPARVTPPPAPSALYPQRGVLILRADESPAYWTSPAPAAAMRLASHYVHRVCDSFALLGLHAFNRTLYANTSAAQGYAGGDELYSASIFGHSAVIVDDALPHTVDEMPPLAGSNEGLYKQGKDEILPGHVQTRTHFGLHAKFASGRATNVYPEVAMTRALVLTRQYLFDAVSLQSPRPRRYLWQVQAIGLACPAEPGLWSPSEWLYHNHPSLQREVSRIAGDRPWGVTFWQETGGVEPREGVVGPQWYERRPGVRLSMLGDSDTIACHGLLPLIKQMSNDQPRDRIVHGRTEPGSSVAAALRYNRRNTCFAALHEPHDGVPRDTAFSRIEERPDAIGVRIRNAQADDRILLGFRPGGEASIEGQSESFRFKDYAFVRVASDAVAVEGDCTGLRVRIPPGATPALLLNGRRADAAVADGHLVYGAVGPVQTAVAREPFAAAAPAALVAARWDREALAVREGGDAAATLLLRNCGTAPATGRIVLAVSNDIDTAPATVDLDGFAAGAGKSVNVRFRVRAGVARHETWRLTPESEGIELQKATLVLGHHVAAWRNWHGSIESDVQVVAPRYHAKLYPRMSGGFAVMIDPDGHRVDMNGGICPRLTAFSARVEALTGKTNEVSETIELGRYTQMFPKAYSEKARREGWIEERDQWQHEGAPFKYRFEADWIALQYYQPRPEHRAYSVEWWPLGSVYRTPNKGHGKAYTAGRIEDLAVAAGSGGLVPRFAAGRPSPDAVFVKHDDRRHGFVQLFPSAAASPGGRSPSPRQPVGGWFAMTFCLPEEFELLAARWVAVRDALEVE
jgi:hypothetical protein